MGIDVTALHYGKLEFYPFSFIHLFISSISKSARDLSSIHRYLAAGQCRPEEEFHLLLRSIPNPCCEVEPNGTSVESIEIRPWFWIRLHELVWSVTLHDN